MSNNSWRILITLAVAIHGIGHSYFLVYALGLVQRGQADRSWLLSGRLPDAAVVARASSLGRASFPDLVQDRMWRRRGEPIG
jgi:hypothetical protein